MAILVLDPVLEERIKADRGECDRDEVWDGVLVMSPLANIEHQFLGGELCIILRLTVGPPSAGLVFNGVNVSDRDEGWLQNYREPDVAVYLPRNPARDCGTHWQGGPDLAVEIVSPHDRARDKAAFYASVGVRELLVLDRAPWALELYRRAEGGMALAAVSTPETADPVRLEVLPLALRLVAGAARPTLEVVHLADGRRWEI